ncbi:hypothetical protein [Cupriavidus basilensis]
MSDSKPPSVRSEFRTEAVIDWIELTFTTRAPTQQQWVRGELHAITGDLSLYVEPLQAGDGGVSSQFAVKFQDAQANSYAALARIVAALDRVMPLDAQPIVTGLEISLDFYSKSQGHADQDLALARMTHRLQNSIAAYGNPRQFNPALGRNVFLYDPQTGRNDFIPIHGETDPYKINPDLNLRIGKKGGPISWQVYHKRIDRNQALPPSEHRARAEFTLRGSALTERKIADLPDLVNFQFETLAGLLHFRSLKSVEEITVKHSEPVSYAVGKLFSDSKAVTLCPLGRLAFRRDARTDKPRNRGMPEVRKHSKHATADGELNHVVRDRLKDLSRAFSTKN